jgi:replicative DNA helicase
MTDSTYLNSIADYIKSEYFEQPNIAKYFEIVKDFYDKRQKLPTITEIKPYLTTDGMRNDFKRLVESFKDIDKTFDKDELYQNTERFLKERATWCNILEIAENSEKKVKNPSEVLEAFEDICKICLDTERGIELFEDVDKLIDDILNEDVYISSGWEWVDEHLGGGYRQDGKALYVFAGQANIGKSIFLGNVAANIAEQGKNVLVVSLEMSEMLYAKRIASNVTKIPLKNFKEDAHTLRYALKEEGKTSGKLFIKEFPPSTITPKQLSAFIKKLIDTGIHLDAIVIDYVSLLHTEKGTNSYERIKYICEQVRAMSYIFLCPIITAVQLQRCLDVNSEVVTIDGNKKIGELVVGDRVMGRNGYVDVRYVYPKETKKVYKITTKSGKTVICSKDHIFPTVGGENKCINGGLSVGDSLFTAVQ